MSHFDDAKPRRGLRSWLMASLIMVAPLVWVGTQALDQPLYMVNPSRAVHAALVNAQAPARRHVNEGIHAPLVSDARVLFALKAIDARAGNDAPWLSGARARASEAKGKRVGAIALENTNTQVYQLAVAEPR